MKSKLHLLLIFAGSLILSGCVLTTYKHPNGAQFSRIAIGSTQSVGTVDVRTQQGDSLHIGGYSSESAQTAAAVVEAAVLAAKK